MRGGKGSQCNVMHVLHSVLSLCINVKLSAEEFITQ